MIKKKIEIILTSPYLRALDHLVDLGIYLTREELILDALRLLFRLYNIEPFVAKGTELEGDVPSKQ